MATSVHLAFFVRPQHTPTQRLNNLSTSQLQYQEKIVSVNLTIT